MLDACPTLTPDFAANLRRLMARQGISLDELAAAAAVDRRTIAAVLRGKKRPHSRTLYRLAEALTVPADEFFQDPSLLAHRAFDRQTNPLVDEVVADRPELFAGWSHADFDELYSRFGAGGALTREGARMAAERMNRVRAVQEKVALVLETHEAELLEEFVELLYRRVAVEVMPVTRPSAKPAEKANKAIKKPPQPTRKRAKCADSSQNSDSLFAPFDT
jgi:transcriptional regulator with XRE-family HTH domain